VPGPDEAPLLAVPLPPSELAPVALAAWDVGEAVLPLDPAAPAGRLRRLLTAMRPTHLVDRHGRERLTGGVPVPHGVVAVVATSGTTGEPKGVELTREGMEVGARAYCAGLGAGPADRWLGCLPTHHVAGLATLARGRVCRIPWALHDRFDPERVARSPREEGATLVLVVPTMLRRLVELGQPLDGFRRILVGAGPLPPDLRSQAEALGATIVHTYGMTEAWGGVALDGRPLDGVELRIADDGEILVRTPMLMRGYRLRPDLTRAVVDDDGWYHTGDVGELVDGALRVSDRTRDLIKSGGVTVSPTEVDHVLAAHPAVADVCTIGIPDDVWGERVVACVVPVDPTAPPDLAELRAFAAEHLPPASLPREVRVIASVPRSPSGKPLRRLLRDG